MNPDSELKQKIAEMESLQRQLAETTAKESEHLVEIRSLKANCAATFRTVAGRDWGQKLAAARAQIAPIQAQKAKIQAQIASQKADIARVKRIIQIGNSNEATTGAVKSQDDLWFLETLCGIIRRACDSSEFALCKEESAAFQAAKKKMRQIAPEDAVTKPKANSLDVIDSFIRKVR